MRMFLTALFTWISVTGFTQTQIFGAAPAQPGSTEVYEVVFETGPHWATIITWSVTGGTVLSSSSNPTVSPIECWVQWDNDPATPGIIEVSEDLNGQYAMLETMTAMTPPEISPYSQTVSYAATPAPLQISFGIWPGTVSFQWQQWNGTWNNLSGQTNSFYQPPAALTSALYRCEIIADGLPYQLESSVTVPALDPGVISLISSGGVNFNAVPQVNASNASGGFCASNQYSYTWEYSLENGPWISAGTSAGFPVAAPAIVGTTRIRRRVVCGGQELYTNTLTIVPNFTAGDFENRNYVRELTVLKSGVQSWQQADGLLVGDKLQSTTYFDGQGKSLQRVEKQVSLTSANAWNDLVTPFDYLVNTSKAFLPYSSAQNIGKFKSTAIADQATYIQSLFGEPSTAPTYELTQLEASPMQRPIAIMPPGQSWGGSGVGSGNSYGYNESAEGVIKWQIDGVPVNYGAYPEGRLLKTVTTDENGKKTVMYTDFDGDLILKKVQNATGSALTSHHSGWLCTYYVYDDWKRLAFVLPPKLVDLLLIGNFSEVSTLFMATMYSYDERGRMTMRGGMGVGQEYFIYDHKNRPVLSQDANQKTRNEWSFSLYDELNRKIATGTFEKVATVATMQAYAHNMNNGNVSISVYVGNGQYQSLLADNPIAGSTGTSTYCNGCTGSTLTYTAITHYDNYNYVGAKAVNNNYSLAYNSGNYPTIDNVSFSSRTVNLITGRKIRLTDQDNNPLNDKFMFSTVYYDERGRVQQELADNVIGGQDVSTLQYDFAGRRASSYLLHSNPAASYTVLTKNELDKIGRVIGIHKNYNNAGWRAIAAYAYSETGQLKSKKLAPDYGTNGLETLHYDFTIRGWFGGINKDYALSNNNYTQWDHYFGLYLGYDNRDQKFLSASLTKNLTGVMWRSQGDNSVRKYDYTYDDADRFSGAAFQQRKRPADGWLASEIDFSSTAVHDAQGNLQSLKHWGVVPGVASPVLIDDLQYTYYSNPGLGWFTGNQVRKVTDASTGLGSNNGLLGDFKGGAHSGDDYTYDAGGNLVKDLNQNIVNGSANGITYNYLNKTAKIVIPGKSTTTFGYNAYGERISKTITPASGPTVTEWYSGDFVYREINGQLQLQHLAHEEGRLKIISPHTKVNAIDYDLNAGALGITWPGGTQGVFDYFIKDHLNSVRMVLTEEVQKEYYLASMESGLAGTEEPLFGKVDINTSLPAADNELQRTRFVNSVPANTPWPGNTTDMVKLNASDQSVNRRTGPNLILRVMAGDVISSKVDYYYLNNNATGPAGNPLSDAIANLLGALASPSKVAELGKLQSAAIGSSLNSNTAFNQFIADQNTSGVNGEPKAYLNMIFLDEQFRFIDADPVTPAIGSSCLRVDEANNPAAFKLLQRKAPKNGWVFIYLSNQSNESVYFDNLNVTQEHSRISEESHYYPYGLKIAGISSQAYNKLSNRLDFQGTFSEEDAETGWNEFALRMYNPQVGRWMAPDPYQEFASPYVGLGANPVNFTDPDGGGIYDGMTLFQKTLTSTVAGFIFGTMVGAVVDDDDKAYKYGLWGAALAGTTTYLVSTPLHPNFYIGPTWDMVMDEIGDKFKLKAALNSAYFGSFVKATLMEVLSLGKIVVVRGDSKEGIGADVNKYYTNNPEASTMDNLTIEFHSRSYGDETLDAKSLDNIQGRMGENTTILMGNCFCGRQDFFEELSNNVNGATVIGHYGYQNDATFLLNGSLTGGNPDMMGDGHLNDHMFKHQIAYRGKMIPGGPVNMTTHVSNAGKISYRGLSQKFVDNKIKQWGNMKSKFMMILEAIFFPTN